MKGQSLNHFILALLTTLAFTSRCSSKSDATTQETNIEFIRTSCNSTNYPTLCFTSLSVHASTIQTSPKILAHTALSVTLNVTKSASSAIKKLSKSKGLKPKEIGAMNDCIEEIIDSVFELKRSIREMKHLKEHSTHYYFMVSNIQTWVSAALTDENTCMDGFAREEMNGKTKTEVRGKIVYVAQLTSIALALVNSYVSHHV